MEAELEAAILDLSKDGAAKSAPGEYSMLHSLQAVDPADRNQPA